MKFADLKHTVFTEMFVNNFAKGDNNKYIVAFRSNIWILDEDTPASKIKLLYKTIRQNHPQRGKLVGYDKYHAWEASDFVDWVKDNVVDVIVGEISDNLRNISLYRSGVSIKTSPLAKKVAQQLNATITNTPLDATKEDDDDDEEIIDKNTPDIGKIPDVMYHGTNTRHIESILKFGLKPGMAESNWLSQGINNPDRIFLASDPSSSKFHSAHSSTRWDPRRYRHIRLGYPILLEVKVPDKSKIDADFDADSFATGKTYKRNFKHQGAVSSVSSMKTSKHIGLFAYKGRIPANFIQRLWFFNENDGEWVELEIPAVKKGLLNWGSELWELGGIEPPDDWDDE